jgi:hypothetical protein
MDENERKRRREEDGQEEEADETSELEGFRKEKPLEGLKRPKAKIQKQKVDGDVHSKDTEAEEQKGKPSTQDQHPKKSIEEKRGEKEQKRQEKRARREEKEKAKQARKAAATKPAESTTETLPSEPAPILNTTERVEGEEDAIDLNNDMDAVDVAGLVTNEQSGPGSAASDSSAADSIFSHTSSQVASSNSSVVPPTTNGTFKAETNVIPAEATTQIDKTGKLSPAEKDALLARLRAKIEAHKRARNADGLNGQPAKNRQELIEARRLKAEKRKAHKKELRQQEKEQSKKAEMEAHLAELRGSPSIGSDMFGSRAGSQSPPTTNFAFGRVAFSDGQRTSSDLSQIVANGKKKGSSDPKAALQAAEKKQARLNSFDESKRADIEQKDLWLNAKKKVHGERVRDDTSLLKKTLKRKEKTKAKSEKEWNERIEGVSKSQEVRQKKREGNIAKRKEEKGSKGKGKGTKKTAPKKKKRPGFEGSFSGRAK